MGFSILTKLLPVFFLPLLIYRFKFKKTLLYSLLVIGSVIVLCLPFFELQFLKNYSNTVGLWFTNFEFNSSFYSLGKSVMSKCFGIQLIEYMPYSVPFLMAGIIHALSRVADFGADAIMIDGAEPGSGEVFDWSLAEGAPSAGHRVLVAGGLHPGNVADAIARVRPWGVDVATGVESAPGRKDPVKLREFIANARAAALELPDDASSVQTDDAPYNWEEDFLS